MRAKTITCDVCGASAIESSALYGNWQHVYVQHALKKEEKSHSVDLCPECSALLRTMLRIP